MAGAGTMTDAEARGRLEALSARLADLRSRLEAEQPPGNASPEIRTGIAMALRPGTQGFLGMRAGPEAGRDFNLACADILGLDADRTFFVGNALRLVGASRSHLARWSRRVPHPAVMTEAVKAFQLAVSMLLGETAADRAARTFWSRALDLSMAAVKAGYGTAWSPSTTPKQVDGHVRTALAIRDAAVAAFGQVTPEYARLMDNRLRRYRPLRFSEGLAPPGHVNSPEERARIRALNERDRKVVDAYRTGAMGIASTVEGLATDDLREMARLAGFAAYACDLFYPEPGPIMTVETDAAGDVTGIALPASPSPIRQ